MDEPTLFDTSTYTRSASQPIADYGVDVDPDPYWAQFEQTLGDKKLDETRSSLDDIGCDRTTEDKGNKGTADVFLGGSLNPTQDPNSPRKTSTSSDLSVSSSDKKNSPRLNWVSAEFLGDSSTPTEDPNSPRNSSMSNKLELSSDINENSPRKQLIDMEVLGEECFHPQTSEGFLGESDAETNSPRKQKRRYGDGSGYIYIRTLRKKGKEYHEAYYHYEFWKNGNCLTKSSKYIPKRLVKQITEMEAEKVPVTDILDLLGVIYW